MKRKLLSLALILALCLSLAVPAAAAQISDTAGANLTAGERRIYNAMEQAVLEITAGKRTSTEITIQFPDRELGWTAGELGLSDIRNDYAGGPVNERLGESLGRVYSSIEYNHPFELFFTRYNDWNCQYVWWNIGSELWLTELTCSLTVTPAYQGGNATTVDPAKIAQAMSTQSTAKAIVQANAGKSNYEKLWAYREAICELTDYNHEALAEIENKTYIYGNPSQAVYVFDGDPNTKVVCEGYSKAFKYLCDLSDFDGDVCCFLVEGTIDGEGHMWNVVRMEDGNYYLTDLTLYDNPAYGGKIPLLARMNEDPESYNYIRTIYNYQRDASGRYLYADLYTDGYLPLCPTPYEPGHAVTPTTPETPVAPADPAAPAAAPAFTDVKSGDWFRDPVQWAVAQNITTGTTATTFSPYSTCTEAQILTFLWRAAGSPEPNSAAQSDAYYAKAAAWAVENGIVDSFQPTIPCTRAMTVQFLWKAAGRPQSGTKPAFTDLGGGADLSAAVAWAVENGVTTGTSATTFDPGATCNRGHIVTFLYRAFGK